jgi:hypothetical protein
VHRGANNITNNWIKDIFLVYSAPDPNGGYDIWKVARLPAGMSISTIDVDDIRAADAGTRILYRINLADAPTIFTAPAPEWVKIRQFATVTLTTDTKDPNIGILNHISSLAAPALALDEAKSYDTGWHLLGSKARRGSEAVRGMIKEWEDMIRANQVGVVQKKK